VKLDGERIVITGATGGLGPSLVEAFLAVGGTVIAVARRKTGLHDLLAELRQHERLRIAECDVTDPDGVRALFHSLDEDAPVDHVCHAAGAFAHVPVPDLADDDISRLIRSNLTATAVVLREALGRMLPRGRGTFTAVAADRALEPAPGFGLYGAAKAGVVHLVSAAALETHGTGVRVNALLPGTMDTPANREAMPDADPSTWTSPRALARSAVWLAGTDAEGVSGALVRLPGK